jgi:diguanylate cyclase (GGDEF)-like protein
MEDKTILIVDDSVINLNILGNLLDAYDLIETTNAETALEILEEEQDVDLILLDIVMPNMDGYMLCKKLKENKNTQNIPIIFITSKTDEDSIAKAYDCGGSDYVTKPFKTKELLARVKIQLKIREMEKELRLLSVIDPLTQLYNRRYFSEISGHFVSLSLRNKQDLSLILIDIDNFKNINDTYGHQVGDDVIILLSNILLEKQRKSDVVCRYGGEEFVILLPNTSLANTQKVAESIRKNVELISFNTTSNEQINFTISLGVSTLIWDEDIHISKLVKRADDGLYHAKRNGKNMSYTT